jgi:hypothetical protein
MTRWYGAYSNRGRRVDGTPPDEVDTPEGGWLFPEEEQDAGASRACRQSWARLLRKIFEVEPMCGRVCDGVMKVVAAHTDPDVVWRIATHIRSREQSRGPPEWAFPGA